MILVVDVSMVVAELIDRGPEGVWAEGILESDTLCAPHLMPVEAANILRRAAPAGDIGADMAALGPLVSVLGHVRRVVSSVSVRGKAGGDTRRVDEFGRGRSFANPSAPSRQRRACQPVGFGDRIA